MPGAVPATRCGMKMTNEALAARLDVLSAALQEVCRVLAPDQATQIAGGLRELLAQAAGGHLKPAADLAMTAELAPLLSALIGPRD